MNDGDVGIWGTFGKNIYFRIPLVIFLGSLLRGSVDQVYSLLRSRRSGCIASRKTTAKESNQVHGPGVRFSKDPKILRARNAIRKTPTRLFHKAGLSIRCKGNKQLK